KAGGCYVPIDPNYPAARIQYIIDKSDMSAVLSHSALAVFQSDNDIWLAMDDAALWLNGDTSNPDRNILDTQLLYQIFTSGSTGEPKSVGVEHAGMTNLLQWYTREYAMSDTDHSLIISALGFDLTQKNLFAALWQGGSVCFTGSAHYDVKAILSAIKAFDISLLNCAPSAFYPLVEQETAGQLNSLRTLFFGGEPIQMNQLRVWLTTHDAKLVNMYGPTECTDIAASFTLNNANDYANQPMPIGQANDNVYLYILNAARQPVPRGVVGELYIAGRGVGRGYLNDDGQTDKVFIPDPFRNEGKMYRTGDLVRLDVDQQIIFVGRIDHQVKLRGLRIELGEIENVISYGEGVDASLVIVKKDQLVAYVIGSANPTDMALACRQALPEYMVPNHIVVLEKYPLTPNGKVDRKALPDPEASGQGYVAPRTALEKDVATLFSQLLQVNKVGLLDNFFTLGGHSLLATQLIAKVEADYHAQIQLRTLFENPTVEALARALEQAKSADAIVDMANQQRPDSIPLSFAQERLWFLQNFNDDGHVFNMPGALRMRGKVDTADLTWALNQLIAKHEVLRTGFESVDGVAMQVIYPELSVTIATEDLSAMALPEQTLRSRIDQCARQVFDLQQPALFSVNRYLMSEDEEESVLVFVMHHIIADGWSLGVFISEWISLYQQKQTEGEQALEMPELQYADYALWQRDWLSGERLTGQIAFWQKALAGSTTLNLPTDFSRPAVQQYQGELLHFTLPASLHDAINLHAKLQEATPFMVLMSAYMVMLARYAGQDDICVGSPIAGRGQAQTQSMLGLFINTLTYRGDVAKQVSFNALIQQVRQFSLDAYANQDIPFEKLVDALKVTRDTSYTPVFQTLFTLQNTPEVDVSQLLSDVEVKLVPAHQKISKYDLSLELAEKSGVYEASFEYRTDLFSRETIERFSAHFVELLGHLLAQPEQSVYALPMLTGTEQSLLLETWNETSLDYPSSKTIVQIISGQALKYPEEIAAADAKVSISYRQLDEQSAQLASRLMSLGVQPDQLVGLCVERSVRMLVAMLAIAKAGGAYVPLDPLYPQDRLDYMLEDGGVSVLVTELHLPTLGPDNLTRVFIDADWDEVLDQTISDSDWPVQPNNLAYVIYTSGSTGKPKGVEVEHQQLLNFLYGMRQTPGFKQQDRLLSVTSLSFDIAGLELWLPLITGASVYIADRDLAMDGELLATTIEQQAISVMQATPATWKLLLDANWQVKKSLKVLCGGEPLPEALASQLTAQPLIELWNMYGPTETTIWSSVAKVVAGEQITIGRPIGNTSIYILDELLQPVPLGAVGDLYIGGDGVTRGYHGRADLTAEVFIDNPFTQAGRIYKTGDLARYLPDGVLLCLGRSDTQVKVRGFRVELGEIEALLSLQTSVKEAVVVTRPDASGELRLVAYVIPDNEDIAADELRNQLKQDIPDYMVPAAFVSLTEFPLTPNEKIDRKALPAPEFQVRSNEDYVAPETDEQQQMAVLWSELLQQAQVGLTDQFFELGGHSLLATQLTAKVKQIFDVALPLRVIFDHPVLADFCAQLSEKGVDELPLVAVEREGALPLSYAQERLWFVQQYEQSAIYNIHFAVELTGQLNVEWLQNSFKAIIERHEVFRTQFGNDEGVPQVLVQDTVELPWFSLDLSESEQPQVDANQAVLEDARTAFDLNSELAYRISLIKVTATSHILSINQHHIISDGWSIGLLVAEVASLYKSFSEGTAAELHTLPVQYVDYSIWLRKWLVGGRLQQELDFWTETLKDSPALLNLPTDRPRPAQMTFNGCQHRFDVPAQLQDKISGFCQAQNITPYMLLLAAYNVLLSRYSGMTDMVIGSPIAGRQQEAVQALMGYFVNGVVMRTSLDNNPTFAELLLRQKDVVLQALAHQDVPFEQVIEALSPERNLSYSPIVQVGFALQNTPIETVTLADLVLSPVELDAGGSKYDMTLMVLEGQKGYSGLWEYNTDLFDEQTIATMAQAYLHLLDAAIETPDSHINWLAVMPEAQLCAELGIDETDFDAILPLTVTQRDLYLDSKMNPETTMNSLGYVLHIHQETDPDVWRQSLQKLADAHPVLRTTLHAVNKPYLAPVYQAHKKDYEVDFTYIDYLEDRLTSKQVDDMIHQFVYQPYAIDVDPLHRNALLKISQEHYVFVISSHHLLMDGTSGTLHALELNKVMSSLLANEDYEPLPNVFPSYVKNNIESFDLQDTKTYWREKSASVEPLSFQWLPNTQHEKVHVQASIDKEKWAAIKKYCRRNRLTPSLLLKSLYALLLKEYCLPDSDYGFYEIVGGRVKEHLKGIGCYYQQTPIIIPKDLVNSETLLTDYFTFIRGYQRALGEHKNFSVFEQRQLMPSDKINFFFNLYGFAAELDFLGQKTELEQQIPLFFDDQVHLVINAGYDDVVLNLHYHSDYFNDLGLLDRLVLLTERCLDGAERLHDLPWITLQEQSDQINHLYPYQAYPTADTLVDRFESSVKRFPGNIAVSDEYGQLTYAELEQQSNQLARLLVEKGATNDVLIGLYCNRSINIVVAILAVLKSGAGYLPLDPSAPNDRIAFIVEDAKAVFVITEQDLQDQLASSVDTVLLDDDRLSGLSTEPLYLLIQPEHLAYVIYTSGSTGKPKGVQIEHQQAVRLMDATHEWYEFDETDVWTLFHSYAFDFSVWEIWGGLFYGGEVVVVPYLISREPEAFYQLLVDKKVTVLNQTPSAFYQLIRAEQHLLSNCDTENAVALRYVIFGGEALDFKQLDSWFDVHGDQFPTLVNMYGITETTVHVTYRVVTAEDVALAKQGAAVSSIIGVPIPDLQVYIVNSDLQLVPIGIPGELCVGGAGLARGYLYRPELTAEKFVENPFTDGKLYRSGDLARHLPDGGIEYLGRIDSQVKIRGFRIELGEIESVIAEIAGVEEVVVIVREDIPGDQRLTAYLVANHDADIEQIKTIAGDKLPAYMVPSSILQLPVLPLTGNGKVDRKALPKPDSASHDQYVAAENELQAQLCQMWSQLLSVSKVGIEDNFFALGGHSLLATQLIASIRTQFKVDIPLKVLFESTTVKALALAVAKYQNDTQDIPEIVPLAEGVDAPLSFSQERLWFIDQLEPNSSAYNIPAAVMLKGDVNIAAIERALNTIVARHDVLRTTFTTLDGVPIQRVQTTLDIPFVSVNVEGDAAQFYQSQVISAASKPFSLTQGPLIRAFVCSGEDEVLLLVTMHHSVSDGWSVGVLVRELIEYYSADVQ
ncbi:MAG: amino acid adenylation domain-containing protein, partial [Methylococcales bacterium]|nr:amino acid adenylation domain-containing protein [Methylococcales bacterium]